MGTKIKDKQHKLNLTQQRFSHFQSILTGFDNTLLILIPRFFTF